MTSTVIVLAACVLRTTPWSVRRAFRVVVMIRQAPVLGVQCRADPDSLVGAQEPYGAANTALRPALRQSDGLIDLEAAGGAAGLVQYLRNVKVHPDTRRATRILLYQL